MCAAICGLIEPSMEYGGTYAVFITVAGVFVGALFLYLVDKLMPRINQAMGVKGGEKQGRALLLVAAIAIHHLPEGIAAGVSFGTGNIGEIVMVCGGIAIQNMPEAAVIIAPMLNAGITRKRAMVIALIPLAIFLPIFSVTLESSS